MLREWYMHPNGQIPAYEWSFGDVNPPVHAWACWRVYQDVRPRGQRDVEFLARAFQKLIINFTWWVNRKDVNGRHLFAGGFLGLDNIGVFDRSRPLPTGASSSRRTAPPGWRSTAATMLSMRARSLARHDSTYDDVASKFFEHFVAIADAMNTLGGSGLWDEQDGFYYDLLRLDDASHSTADPLDRGDHPDVRSRNPRRRSAGLAAAVPPPDGVVPREPRRSGGADLRMEHDDGNGNRLRRSGSWRSRARSGWSGC